VGQELSVDKRYCERYTHAKTILVEIRFNIEISLLKQFSVLFFLFLRQEIIMYRYRVQLQ